MSKAITFHAIGDVHISDRHLNLSHEAMENCIKLVQKRPDVDVVVIMGDILDRHDNVKLTHLNMAISFIKRMSELRPTVVLIGNHDRVNNKDFMSDVHPFMGLSDIPGKLYFASRPKVLRFAAKYHVLFMPYVPPGRFEEAINLFIDDMHKVGKIKEISGVKDFSLIFAHQEFEGAPCGPISSIKGDKWPADYPMVISGHIHTRMLLKDNIYYTGSLYPITTSEGNDKGVITGSYDPLTRMLDCKKPVRVITSQKVVLHVNAKDEDSIREMLTLDREHTKYVVTGTPEELASIKAKAKEKNLNIVYDARPNRSMIQSTTFDGIISKYITDDNLKTLLAEVVTTI